MPLNHLEVRDLRRLTLVEIQPSKGLNLIIGPNASGKTSVLEAISLIGLGRSFRTSKISETIAQGKSHTIIVAEYEDETGTIKKLGMRRGTVEHEIKIDGQKVERVSTLAKVFPLQVATPESHYVVLHNAKQRRGLMDWGLFHVEPDFHQYWSAYQRALKQRNLALKQRDPSFSAWDRQIEENGRWIHQKRNEYLGPLSKGLSAKVKRLTGEKEAELIYKKGWAGDRPLKQCLIDDRNRDLAQGYTHSGPHRADIGFRLSGNNILETGSHGQQKLFVLAYRLAQIEWFYEISGRKTVVLLDDVAAELDPERRALVLDDLLHLETQAFITATTTEDLPARVLGLANVFHVEQGRVFCA